MIQTKFLKKFTLKQYLTIFLILLSPAMLRHLSYYDTYTSTGVYPSISPESKEFFKNDNYLMFFLEEAFLSAVLTLIYFTKWDWLKFLTFGYLIDPIIDIIAAIYTKMTGILFLPSFALREIILPYALTGFVLLWVFKDLKKVWRPVYIIISGLLIYQFLII
ncbi:MAG: hypothetical protein GON13_01035 [Nanoarchaeota archaeon]|nr:hypothetical protein [Nanoarchaeota archaeon]